MFEFVGSVFALGIVAQIIFWVVAAVLFPVFWIWMLVDAALRHESEYPNGSVNEKIFWLVAMLVVQFVSVVYFFAVFRAVERGARETEPVQAEPPAAPTAPVTPAPVA